MKRCRFSYHVLHVGRGRPDAPSDLVVVVQYGQLVVLGDEPSPSGFGNIPGVRATPGAGAGEHVGRRGGDGGVECCHDSRRSTGDADEEQLDGQAVLLHPGQFWGNFLGLGEVLCFKAL